ncbi:hypothetical protein H4R33_002064 [Dimargaris cristalligena]|uniref:Guanine nucleotide-binding protein subunit gamma n=1 Tax=Dimargaris cristalligena TaxID=215637 RepID=A0A4P9ZYN6_9FUNG|nr:hypothetical protein H4R33_002064 [Dimargaris cristalligena]RKP38072.1 hypothetical protein BJ085DRAFT_14469 [Dimargaris cristalligena]|eukprot:RKP38072.1 hypothetical protein BJ085DRAFT_14469 [Dimargaris cristalligena]
MSVAEVRYQKLVRQNDAHIEQLNLPRIAVSEASRSIIEFTTQTSDPMIPSIWGQRTTDPFSTPNSSCCSIV